MSGEDELFDISEFIDSQKWILASMGVFAAIAIRLQNWPNSSSPDLISIGIVSSLCLFGFMAYLLTKNLISELDGFWSTLEFILEFRLASIELIVFLTLFYLLSGVILSFSTQFTVGFVTVAKMAVFLLGFLSFYFGMLAERRVSRTNGVFSLLFFIMVSTGLVETSGFHFSPELIDVILYVIQSTSSPRMYVLAFALGLVALPALLFVLSVISILVYPIEMVESFGGEN